MPYWAVDLSSGQDLEDGHRQRWGTIGVQGIARLIAVGTKDEERVLTAAQGELRVGSPAALVAGSLGIAFREPSHVVVAHRQRMIAARRAVSSADECESLVAR